MKSLSQTNTRRLICATLIGLLLTGFVLHAAIQFRKHQNTEDFGLCYQAARAMLEGNDMYTAAAVHYVYPPFFAFAFQPLALLPEIPAAIIWSVISAGLLLLALLVAAKEVVARWPRTSVRQDASWPWLIATISSFLVADKIHAMFTLGQTDSLMLLGFACALLWMDRRPVLAGLAIGATANVKYLSLICVPYFLLKRNYRAAASSIGAFIVLMILPAAEIGFARLAGYMGTAFAGLARMVGLPVVSQAAKMYKVDYERSLSFTSAAFRLTRAHGLSDVVAVGMSGLLFVAVIGTIIVIARAQGVRIFYPSRNDSGAGEQALVSLEWAVLVFLALAFSPQTMSRHMILLSLVFTVALGVLFSLRARAARTVLIIAMAVMVAGLSLPLKTLGLSQALGQWRAVAGPSWCALFLILVLVWSGTRAIKEIETA